MWAFFGTYRKIDGRHRIKHTRTEKGEAVMEKIYFTITGTNHYFGNEFLKPDMKVRLIKEPDNDYDKEAIKVELEGLGIIGYVANSPYTVAGESYSAGRLYDKIGDTSEGTVMYVLNGGVLGFVTIDE